METMFEGPVSKPRIHFVLVGFLAIFLFALTACNPSGTKALLKGKEMLDQGRAPEAITLIRRALESIPNEGQAWNLLGNAYQQTGEPSLALEAYNNALRHAPTLSIIHYNQGLLHLGQGKYSDAIAELTRFNQHVTNHFKGWLKLGDALFLNGKWKDAEECYNYAKFLQPDSPLPQNQLGVLYTYRQNYREAYDFFRNSIQLGGTYPTSRLNIALLAHHFQNLPELALEQYDQFLKIAPESPYKNQVLNHLSLLKTPAPPAQDRNPEVPREKVPDTQSPALASTVTNVPPTTPDTNLNLTLRTNTPANTTTNLPLASKSSTETNNLAKTPDTAKSGEASPSDKPVTPPPSPSTRFTLSDFPAPDPNPRYIRFSYGSLPGSSRNGDRAKTAPFFLEGRKLLSQNAFQDATQAFQQAVRLDPQYYEAQYNLGVAALRANNAETALRACEMALLLAPAANMEATRLNFAMALSSSGYPYDAALELRKNLSTSPDEVETHFLLAQIYGNDLQLPDLASRHFKAILTLEPNHRFAANIREWLSQSNP